MFFPFINPWSSIDPKDWPSIDYSDIRPGTIRALKILAIIGFLVVAGLIFYFWFWW